ncbi:nitrous oxide reductase accessory protein NosL [Natronolimnobius sp. AArcel1]|uniref:nitrous oxide reductase accessory protein NosL n=1 Tax=Natronolimnobius sp. AArcel1 TaxID=1679093 RepID=UPI0013ED5B04|nr:nitrous oxide reductase accessory protein NosL [Natronolimnobius sp. AArcel1]NGM70426.1 nitrous oxide reductase accessory protein NosL [Natronolimnobius sp. AArcel1]
MNGSGSSPTDRHVSRRTVLLGSAAVSLTAVAGCLGDGDGEAPDPMAIEDGPNCDNCTMPIVDHPGPVGQAFYDDAEELFGEDRPAQFCSSLCTYTHTFDHEDEYEPLATYITDYSTVEYEVDSDSETPTISSHVDADDFASVNELTLVVGSEVEGAMGASMIGFSESDDADAFQEEYGGDHYDHDDVDHDLVMSLM